jgi:hypothetical protein
VDNHNPCVGFDDDEAASGEGFCMNWTVGCWGRPGSNSAKVAAHIAHRANIPVMDFLSHPELPVPDNLIIVTSNLGDEEVPEDVERFLVSRGNEFRNWTIVEIGNYYGFDDWNYGAGNRIAMHFRYFKTANQTLIGVGIDSLPLIDFLTLDRWCDEVLLKDNCHAV